MSSPPRSSVKVRVAPLPRWLDLARFLGVAELTTEAVDAHHVAAEVAMTRAEAADLAARLRGLGVDGRELVCTVAPPLARPLVREGRLRDARARRETTPGFADPRARASDAGRYSLTPEPLALALGRAAEGRSVVDACCGSGGNALGFARAGSSVVAIELDAARLEEARHNARVYGVASKLEFVLGDALALVPTHRAEILFVDPPWGADYDKRRTTLADFPLLEALLQGPIDAYGELWMKLPASFETASVLHDSATAVFGEGGGDLRRIKFVLLRRRLGPREHAA